MARPRVELQELLEDLMAKINPKYAKNVYFRPPSVLKFPCITYKHSGDRIVSADNKKYLTHKKYTITIIDEDPDSEISDAVAELPLCSIDREFESDNLNHFVYTIFF